MTGKFGFGVQNEAGQRLIEFCQENANSYQTPSSNNTREDSTHGHHQKANTEIRLIICFVAKRGEALYSQQKQDWELTVAQIMNSLLPFLDFNTNGMIKYAFHPTPPGHHRALGRAPCVI